MERYIHYSAGPIVKAGLDSIDQGRPWMKPRGLWFSVEGGANGGWKRWCLAEGFEVHKLAHGTELFFCEDARLLRGRNRRDILRITERYYDKDHPSNDLPAPIRFALDWERVAKDYQGIAIAPYVWECRLSDWCFWYYSWDCACGCVWDVSAIERVEGVSDEVQFDGNDGA